MKRKLSFLMVLLLVVGIAGVASAANWTCGGTDNEWTNNDNWDVNYPGGGIGDAYANYNDNSATDYTIELTTDVGTIGSLYFGRGHSGTGTTTLNIQASGNIHATGNGLFDGNVGIGTSSPETKLDVNGNAQFVALLDRGG